MRASPPPKPKEGALPPRRSNFEMRSIVPFQGGTPSGQDKTPTSGGATSSFKRAASVRRRSTLALGALQPSPTAAPSSAEERVPVPSSWIAPEDTGGGYERSELGNEITAEVRRWLIGDTSGPQCSQVVLDRALTVLSNFKLASGCQLEVLGGPLGAIIGGYSDADWLHAEVFQKQPADAIREAFALLGFKARAEGDWSNFVAEEVSLAYRRLCLRGHPSRGGSPRSYLKLQVAMELVRAFAGEAGPLARGAGDADGYTLNDQALSRELKLTTQEAEEEATKLPKEQLEEMNRALDEYILRQMCFKSEIVDEIARLHENSAYALLGVSSDATDTEIKRAYRLVARECHPDKGGDKEEFQELNAAFERIMEQRKAVSGGKWSRNGGGGDADGSDQEQAHGPDGDQPKAKGSRANPKGKNQDHNDEEGTEEASNAKGEDKSDAEADSDGASEDEYAEEGSNAQLIEKASKAAEEASRYAKTAAEFAHQAADAAETARKGREQGSQDTLTKSIAHSAIVLTLTVVKAVRVVGYATLDVAAQCRAAAQRNPDSTGCAERSVEAMSLGLEALNAALACAEVTEITAAELQGTGVIAPGSPEGGSGSSAAERFVGAAVRASLSAAGASNAAMTAAIAAVEGSRQVMEAVGEAEEQAKSGKKGEDADGTSATKADGAEDSDGAEDVGEDVAKEISDSPPRHPKQMSPEEAAAAARRRLVSQRHNNHKVLHRLNAEILSHQQNVRQFLQANRQLIPEISEESKQRVMRLLQDYCREARADLESALQLAAAGGPLGSEALLAALTDLQILVPVLQPTQLAISVSVKARVLKMAALYDLPRAVQVLEQEVFAPVRAALRQDSGALARVAEISEKVQQELTNNVAEQDAAESSPH